MLLYICLECGRWSDVSLGKFLADSWNNAFKSAQIEQSGYPCPAGHGLMVQVTPQDRLFVRPGTVDQALIPPSGQKIALSKEQIQYLAETVNTSGLDLLRPEVRDLAKKLRSHLAIDQEEE